MMMHLRILPHYAKVFAIASWMICFFVAVANASDTKIAVPCNLETKSCSGLEGYIALSCIPSDKEKRQSPPADTEKYYPHWNWINNKRFFINVGEKIMRPYGIMNDVFVFWEMDLKVSISRINWWSEIWEPEGFDYDKPHFWTLNQRC